MSAILQCPNSACGRQSRLGDDPLGRIFRCPRCLTKLPAAAATAADSRWTMIVGPPRQGCGKPKFQSSHSSDWAMATTISGMAVGRARRSLVHKRAGGTSLGPIEVGNDHSYSLIENSLLGLGPDESGEVLIEPVFTDSRSSSDWGTTSASSLITVDNKHNSSEINGTVLSLELDVRLGRFQVLKLLGQGEHARVYRAYDPVLDRDVALKVPRHELPKNTKLLNRFLGEAKALRACNIRELYRCMKLVVSVSSTSLRWRSLKVVV